KGRPAKASTPTKVEGWSRAFRREGAPAEASTPICRGSWVKRRLPSLRTSAQVNAAAETAIEQLRAGSLDGVAIEKEALELAQARRRGQGAAAHIADAVVGEVQLHQAGQMRRLGQGLRARITEPGAAQVQSAHAAHVGGGGESAGAAVAEPVAR